MNSESWNEMKDIERQKLEKRAFFCKEAQQIAKRTMDYARKIIKPGMPLPKLRESCEAEMRRLGADSFWYWDIGAFVFSGNETAVSISGKDYKTADKIISWNDIITIDLSPQINGFWGDYARTIIIENGTVIDEHKTNLLEWRAGIDMEDHLHCMLMEYAKPETCFEELYLYFNNVILENGFMNCDFLGNLGHSIEEKMEERIYIENGNTKRLGEVVCFTFEPHICVPGSEYGFKKEDIYFFQSGRLAKL